MLVCHSHSTAEITSAIASRWIRTDSRAVSVGARARVSSSPVHAPCESARVNVWHGTRIASVMPGVIAGVMPGSPKSCRPPEGRGGGIGAVPAGRSLRRAYHSGDPPRGNLRRWALTQRRLWFATCAESKWLFAVALARHLGERGTHFARRGGRHCWSSSQTHGAPGSPGALEGAKDWAELGYHKGGG